jgi:hypothetical protein
MRVAWGRVRRRWARALPTKPVAPVRRICMKIGEERYDSRKTSRNRRGIDETFGIDG